MTYAVHKIAAVSFLLFLAEDAAAQCVPIIEPFNTSLGIFTPANGINGNWVYTNNCARSTLPGHTAPGSAFFQGNSCQFGNGSLTVSGDLLSPLVQVPAGGGGLSFNYYIANECGTFTTTCFYDVLQVDISNNAGVSYTTIAASNTGGLTTGGWHAYSYNLAPYAGQWIQVRFRFNSIDGVGNAYDGIYVDDVMISNQPLASLGPDTLVCDTSAILQTPFFSNYTYLWSNGATGTQITVNQSGTYWVQVGIFGCYSYDTINVTLQTPPTVNLGADSTLCPGPYTLTGPGPPLQHLWSNSATSNSITVSQAGVYWLKVTDSLNCTASDTVVFAMNNPMVFAGPDTTLCGTSYAMQTPALTGYSYSWSNGSTSSQSLATQSGMYTVNVQFNGCSASDTVNVTLNPLPVVNLGPDTTLCETTLTLNAGNSGSSFLWSNSAVTQSIAVNQSGTYSVVVIDANGCSSGDQVLVNFIPYPVFSLGNDTALCGDSLQLSVPPGYLANWSNGATSNTTTAYQSGSYNVALDNNGCISYDTIQVILNPIPYVDLGPDTFFCKGSMVLDAENPGATYLWSNGSTGQTLVASSTGIYSVTTSYGPCTDSDAIVLTIGPNPTVDLGNDTALCANTVLLNAGNPGSNFLWSDGSSGQTFTVSASGTYHVIVSQGVCVEMDSINIHLDTPLDPIYLPGDTSICGGPLLLEAGTNGPYTWSTGVQANTFSVQFSGIYWVQAVNGVCVSGDTILVNIFEQPDVQFGNDTLLCPGQTLYLEMDYPGAQFHWSDGTLGSSRFVNEPGLHWGEAILGMCRARDSVYVEVAEAPSLPERINLCESGIVTLHPGTVNGEYIWEDGETSLSRKVETAGYYSIRVEEGHCIMEAATSVSGGLYDRLYVPNAFSPDGDGVNDFFPASFIPEKDYLFEVYTRWGDKVFTSTDQSNWDGTFAGIEAPIGTYIYRIVYFSTCSGQDEVLGGHVVLLR